MAWSWSHTVAAYVAARQNLGNESPAFLAEVAAEWAAHAHALSHGRSSSGLDDFEATVGEASRLATLDPETLADSIWDLMEQAATCDNGGHNAWACPDGCHTVPFSTPEELVEQAEQEA